MQKRYEGLLGLRGIGAVMIIAYHMYILEDCNGSVYSGINGLLDRTVGLGGLFVQLFFMLSSFSLMCGYAEKAWNNNCDWEQFYLKRFVRLAPVFYTTLVLHLLLNVYAHVQEPVAHIIGTASLLYVLMPSHQTSIVMAAWAMGIEVIFYLIFPAFLCATKTKFRTLLAVLASALLQFTYQTFYGIHVENAEINILFQLLPFLLGALLYHSISYMESMNRKKRIVAALISYIVLLCLFLGWGTFFTHKIFVYLAFCLIILNQIGYTDILVNNALCKWLGSISYEMYLFHPVIYRILYYIKLQEKLAGYFSSRLTCYIVFFVTVFLLTILLSYAVRKLFHLKKHLCLRAS